MLCYAKSLQSCPTLCDPIDGSPPGSPVPGILQARTCHFLLQCMKVKRESEVAQSCPTLSDPMDCSLPGCSINGIFQARVLEWGTIAFSGFLPYIDMNQPWVYICPPSWTPLPPPSPSHPSGSSQCNGSKHPVSCIKHGLAICFTYGNIRFNAILSNHPTLAFSHRVQKSVLYICVSFAVLHVGSSLSSF